MYIWRKKQLNRRKKVIKIRQNITNESEKKEKELRFKKEYLKNIKNTITLSLMKGHLINSYHKNLEVMQLESS